jgi:hypothetical protein
LLKTSHKDRRNGRSPKENERRITVGMLRNSARKNGKSGKQVIAALMELGE